MASPPRLLSTFSWISRYAKPILVNGSNVNVMYSPHDYYNCVKNQILSAKDRIQISSLYFGTSPKEKELVSTLNLALKNNPNLQCTVLLDYLRGNRGHPNSLDMFKPLLDSHPHQFHLHMHHTPHLRGFLKRLLPKRFNEIVGLQHTKINIFDNTVLLTGANLSEDYFTNRQDRYILFYSCPQLANYLSTFHKIISSHSFVMSSDKGVTNPPVMPTVNPLTSKDNLLHYKHSLEKAVLNLVGETQTETSIGMEHDTVVYPLIQMGRYNIKQDELVTEHILANTQPNEQIYLASGYFNLPKIYKDAILSARGKYKILASSPECMGFYNAEGIAKYIPLMYVHLATQFLKEIQDRHQINYMEYYRQHWTYHGKGLWYYPSNDDLPLLTLVGSSNYGQRSLTKDLECQVAVVTENSSLRQSFHNECVKLYEYGGNLSLNEVINNPQRKLPLWVVLTTMLFSTFV